MSASLDGLGRQGGRFKRGPIHARSISIRVVTSCFGIAGTKNEICFQPLLAFAQARASPWTEPAALSVETIARPLPTFSDGVKHHGAIMKNAAGQHEHVPDGMKESPTVELVKDRARRVGDPAGQ